MKHWGFKGLPASHGVSLTHRSPGAIGNRNDPGKIWKGKKLPGHMGNERRTVQHCLVYKVGERWMGGWGEAVRRRHSVRGSACISCAAVFCLHECISGHLLSPLCVPLASSPHFPHSLIQQKSLQFPVCAYEDALLAFRAAALFPSG